MGILLSDEEIKKAIRDYGASRGDGYGDDYYEKNKGEFQASNKAQLKKVVELGKRPIGNAILAYADHDSKIDLEEFWKALLKEIE